MYQQLLNAEVIQTDDISSSQTVMQDGRDVVAHGPKGEAHISQRLSALLVYVPREKDAEEICYATSLPRRLANWLMQDPTTAGTQPANNALVLALAGLLQCPAAVVDQVLEHQGIPQVDIPTRDESRLPVVTAVALLPTPSHEGDATFKFNMPPTPVSSDLHSPPATSDMALKSAARPDYFAVRSSPGGWSAGEK